MEHLPTNSNQHLIRNISHLHGMQHDVLLLKEVYLLEPLLGVEGLPYQPKSTKDSLYHSNQSNLHSNPLSKNFEANLLLLLLKFHLEKDALFLLELFHTHINFLAQLHNKEDLSVSNDFNSSKPNS